MKLSRQARRFLVFLHVLASVSWIGVAVVMGVLSFTGLTTDDPRTMATAYTALQMFCVPVLLTLGATSLATGVLLGLGTRFGLVRYWWVVVKLVLNVVLVVLVLVALKPTLADGAAESAVVDASLPDRLALVRTNLIFPPAVSTAALLFATWLGVFKPWGPTRYGRSSRADIRASALPASRRPSAPEPAKSRVTSADVPSRYVTSTSIPSLGASSSSSPGKQSAK